MARCIAFDKQTAQAISTSLHFLTLCDPKANPVESALQSTSPHALLALPAEAGGRVLMARFQRRTGLPDAPLPYSSTPVSFAAGGFLGLSDEPVFDPEPPARKRWWRRILD